MTADRTISILVVESDATTRKRLAAVLENDGFVVTAVSKGRDGRDALTAVPAPALIVLGTTLPDMDWVHFLDWLKASPHEATPVVLLLGSLLGPDAAAADTCAAVVQRPWEPAAVLDTVRQVLRIR
jgi:CheY-like chemotaxis protein